MSECAEELAGRLMLYLRHNQDDIDIVSDTWDDRVVAVRGAFIEIIDAYIDDVLTRMGTTPQ